MKVLEVLKLSLLEVQTGRNEFLYDGVPIYHNGRSVMDVSMFDIGSMDQVEVLRGGNEMFPGSGVSILFRALIMETV